MKKKLIIAGGGTGGHIFCGLAIAEAWKNQGGEVRFVGTPVGMEGKIIPQYGYDLDLIKVKSIKGKSIFGKLISLWVLCFACLASIKILRKQKPDIVMGVGGYASGPMLLMASFLGYPTAIIDQNAYAGFTNRVLAKFVDKIFMTYEISKNLFPKREVLVFGNPILKRRIPDHVEKSSSDFTILILGGSQGAQFINQKIMDIFPDISEKFPEIKMIHQTGKSDLRKVKKLRDKYSIKGEASDFFSNMKDLYVEADLVISRAGAGTLTELSLWGIPALLIPYPHAADDHQYKNAEVYANKDAALLFSEKELKKEDLFQAIENLIKDQKRLNQMSQNMKSLGKPQAAQDVCKILKSMVD